VSPVDRVLPCACAWCPPALSVAPGLRGCRAAYLSAACCAHWVAFCSQFRNTCCLRASGFITRRNPLCLRLCALSQASVFRTLRLLSLGGPTRIGNFFCHSLTFPRFVSFYFLLFSVLCCSFFGVPHFLCS
jgi:hypothetical protein